MRSDMDHTVLPANYTMPAFTPQPQSITALWLVLTWVVGYIKCRLRESNQDTVTHPSTNRTQHRLPR